MTIAVPASRLTGPFRTALVLLLGSLLALAAPAARAEILVPPLSARVTDLTGTLDEARRQALDSKLAAFEARKGSQIAVLLVPTTRPETIEQFGIRVAEAWKLGRKGVDDGVLLLVAKDDRALRIEVGYGLEGAIPDAVGKRVIEEVILPRFRAGDFGGGIDAGADTLIGLVSGEPLPEPERQGSGLSLVGVEESLPLAMLMIVVVGGVLRALLGRMLGAGVAGGVSFLGAWWLLESAGVALIIAFVMFVMTLLGSARGGIYSGGGGGWGGGSSGGGGFGGGGGGFGGGGASGRW